MSTPISLHQLLCEVGDAIHTQMPDTRLVTAEISNLCAHSNGNCYMELIEKGTSQTGFVAKARSIIYRSIYPLVALNFEQATGRPLAVGMKVLMEVKVAFHPIYGLQLDVRDIDPAYTLGEDARRQREIIAMLEADGVVGLNKELHLPRPIRRIAVISTASAAGYGDFCKQLQQSGFPFHTKLFAATMQGEKVEREVIAALNAIADEMESWDVVVVIRGGGAASDLAGFNAYDLATNIAQFPLPVLSGIGHERDDTIVDLVAHTRFKTPTAVAAFLIEQYREETHRVVQLAERIGRVVELRLSAETSRLRLVGVKWQKAVADVKSRSRSLLSVLRSRLDIGAVGIVRQHREQNATLFVWLKRTLQNSLTAEKNRLALIRKTTQMADPARVLALGFSYTTAGGKTIRSVTEAKAGDLIITHLADGSLHSRVVEKNEKLNNQTNP